MSDKSRTGERKFPVRDVTDKNFADVFPEFCKVVEDADFIALDLEFTGTIRRPCIRHCIDTPEMRYMKVREGAVDHAVIQFGVSVFSWQPSTKKHSVASFNFWTFPSHGEERRSRYFMCDSSSLSFLVRNGCDFNKLFREGISYLAPSERDEWGDKIRQRYAYEVQNLAGFENLAVTNHVKLPMRNGVAPPNHQTDNKKTADNQGDVDNAEDLPDYLKKCISLIDAFLASPAAVDDPKSIELDLETGFKRKQFYDAILPRYKDVIVARTQQAYNNAGAATEAAEPVVQSVRAHIKIEKCTPADKRKWLEQRQAEELAKIDKYYAFTAVIDKIRDLRKPIVVHNGFLDLCHTFHHFIHPLPDVYDDFLTLFQRVWPTMYDTRLLADVAPIRDELSSAVVMGLAKLYDTLGGQNISRNFGSNNKHADTALHARSSMNATQPSLAGSNSSSNLILASSASNNVPVKYGDDYDTDGRAHMAGYDAFMTGACFVAMIRRIGTLSQISPRDRAIIFPVYEWSIDPTLSPSIGGFNAGRRILTNHAGHPVGDVLRRLQNKIFLSRSHDYPFIDLSPSLALPATPNATMLTKVPTRKNVFYITFPPEWNLNDIQDRFKQYGRIRIEFIDSQSAALILLDAVANGTPGEMNGANKSAGTNKLQGEELLRVFLQERVNTSNDKQCIVMRYHRLMRELVKSTLPQTTFRLQQKGKFEEFVMRQISGAVTPSVSKITSGSPNTLLNGQPTAANNTSASITLPFVLNNRVTLATKPHTNQQQRLTPVRHAATATNNNNLLNSSRALLKESEASGQQSSRLMSPLRLHRASSVPRGETNAAPALTASSANLLPLLTKSSVEVELVTQVVKGVELSLSTGQQQQTAKRARLMLAKGVRQEAVVTGEAGRNSNKKLPNLAPPTPAATLSTILPAANSYVSRYKLVRQADRGPLSSAGDGSEAPTSKSVTDITSASSSVLGTTSAAAGGSRRMSNIKQRLSLTDKASQVPSNLPASHDEDMGNCELDGQSNSDNVNELAAVSDACDMDDNSNMKSSPRPTAEGVGKTLRRKNSMSLRTGKRKKSTSS